MGTAHISAESVKEVREVIAREQPSVVAVELDEARHKALTEPERWKQTKLVDVIKQGKAFLLLAQAFLSSYQRRLGEQYGVAPGSEMLAAMDEAKSRGATLVLADRDIAITMKRAWGRMGFREKFRVTWEFMKALTGASEAMEEEARAKAAKQAAKAQGAGAGKALPAGAATGPLPGQPDWTPEELLKEDALSLMMAELSAFAPSVSDVLVKERDAYLAGKIRDAAAQAPGGKVVAVIGAGHLRGVEAHLKAPQAIPLAASLEELPNKFPVGKAIAWGLFALVIGVMGLLAWRGFETGDFGQLQDFLIQWTLITGTFSAIGAAAALAHPVSIAVAFLTAPFATIHPLVATGWFSGLSEAILRQPTVRDYEGLSQMTGLKDFWKNRVTRVLLVAALTNIGAMIGTTYMLPVLSRFVLQG